MWAGVEGAGASSRQVRPMHPSCSVPIFMIDFYCRPIWRGVLHHAFRLMHCGMCTALEALQHLAQGKAQADICPTRESALAQERLHLRSTCLVTEHGFLPATPGSNGKTMKRDGGKRHPIHECDKGRQAGIQMAL